MLTGCGEHFEDHDLSDSSLEADDLSPAGKMSSELYITEMTGHLSTLNSLWKTYASATTEITENPTLFYQEGYVDEMLAILDRMGTTLEEINNVPEPSGTLTIVHENIVYVLVPSYEFVVENLPKAFKNEDSELYVECIEEAGTAKMHFEAVRDLMKDAHEINGMEWNEF